MAPHPSTAGHLATETALLGALYTRSREQHRSQVFLRRLEGVLRLAKRVIKANSAAAADAAVAATATESAARVAFFDDEASLLPLLIPKLLRSLVTATRASDAVLALGYFVPLHAALVAGYARLFAVTIAMAAALGIEPEFEGMEERVKPKGGWTERKERRPASELQPEVVSLDVGERVERAGGSSSARATPTPSVGTLKRKHEDVDGVGKKGRIATASPAASSPGVTPSGTTTPTYGSDDEPRPRPKKPGQPWPAARKPPRHAVDMAGVSSPVAWPRVGSATSAASTPVMSAPGSPGTPRADRIPEPAYPPNDSKPKKVKEKSKESKKDGSDRLAAASGDKKTKLKSKDKSKKRKDAMDDIFGF